MTVHVIEDGQDFGVPTNLLTSDAELLSVPIEVVNARAEQRAAWQPKVVTYPVTQGLALAVQKEEAKAETQDLGHSFTYDGETYWIQPADNWDIEIFELIEDGKLVKACRLMLGDKQWSLFKSKPRKAKDFNELFVASQAALSTKS